VAPSWIITLHAGASPALIPEPPAPLARYDFFTSRTCEDGRERFRLHLGFFEDLPSAKRALRLVRESHPAAWLVPADHYQVLRRVSKDAAVVAPVRLLASTPLPQPMPMAVVAPQQDDGAPLEAAEVFALLGGAADLLAGVLPEVYPDLDLDEPVIALDSATSRIGRAAAPAAGISPRDPDQQLAEALVRDVSRFIVEEWQPEARRPLRAVAEGAWYTRFRRDKRPSRSQTAAS
jgi:hypothetical protein